MPTQLFVFASFNIPGKLLIVGMPPGPGCFASVEVENAVIKYECIHANVDYICVFAVCQRWRFQGAWLYGWGFPWCVYCIVLWHVGGMLTYICLF